MDTLGDLYLSAVLARDAVEPLEEAILLLRGSLETDPTNRDYQRQLAMRLLTQGAAYTRVARKSEAVAPMEEAVALRQALLASDPTVVYHQAQLASALGYLGIACYSAGRASESIEALQTAMALYRWLVDSDPTNATYQRDLGTLQRFPGVVFTVARRGDGASCASFCNTALGWRSSSLLIRSLASARRCHMCNTLPWQRRVVDHGSTKVIREDAPFAPATDPQIPQFAESAGRHSRRSGCWHVPPASVSAMLILAPDAHRLAECLRRAVLRWRSASAQRWRWCHCCPGSR